MKITLRRVEDEQYIHRREMAGDLAVFLSGDSLDAHLWKISGNSFFPCTLLSA